MKISIYRLACDSEIKPGEEEIVWTYLPSRTELRQALATRTNTKIDIKNEPYRAIISAPGKAPEHWVVEKIELGPGANIDQAINQATARSYLISGASSITDVPVGPPEERLTPAMVAERLGIIRTTWNAYCNRGTAPHPDGQFGPRSPYWLSSTIDEYERIRRPYSRRG